jgi:hypothetical protein
LEETARACLSPAGPTEQKAQSEKQYLNALIYFYPIETVLKQFIGFSNQINISESNYRNKFIVIKENLRLNKTVTNSLPLFSVL